MLPASCRARVGDRSCRRCSRGSRNRRCAHVVAGITWIGHLYFFNWVNGPFQGKIDGPTKKAVNPELMPRALFWFRWGAAWTWITGVLLAGLIYYQSRQV